MISVAIILVLSIDGVLCSCTGVLTSDTEHSYTVHWSIQQSVVQFNVSANIGSDKWIGLGFSSTAGMFPADMVIGGTRDGTTFIEDRYSTSNSTPLTDTYSNIFHASVAVIDGTMFMTFSRELETTDNTTQDFSLRDSLYWIYAYGNLTSINPVSLAYHGSTSRGIFNTSMSLTDCTGRQCSSGDARIVNGPNIRDGRVDVCHNSTWSAVCDDNWSKEEAQVVCRQLGFYDGEPVCCGAFGNGLGIVTDSFNCTGSELNLLGCTRSQSCDNASIEAVGVVCTRGCESPYCTAPNIVSIEVMLNASDPVNNQDAALLICNAALDLSLFVQQNTIFHVASYWTRDSEPITDADTLGAEFIMVNSSSFTSILTISSSNSSGEYECIAEVRIIEELMNRTTNITTNSLLNVPDCISPYCISLPFVSIEVTPSSTDILYTGDTIVLICTFEHDIVSSNSILSVTSQWTRNSKPLSGINNSRIMTDFIANNSTSFMNTLNISNLDSASDNGEYVCVANITVTDESLRHTTVTATSSYNITVQCLSPYCTISSFVSTEITSNSTDVVYSGDTAVLMCTISLDYDISASSSIISVANHWRRNGQPLSSINDSRISTDLMMNNLTSFTSVLSISTASDIIDAGEYQCIARVAITEENIMATILTNASINLIVGIAPATSTITPLITQVTSSELIQTTSELVLAPSMTVMTKVSGDNLSIIVVAGSASGAFVLFVVLAIIIILVICVVFIKYKGITQQTRLQSIKSQNGVDGVELGGRWNSAVKNKYEESVLSLPSESSTHMDDLKLETCKAYASLSNPPETKVCDKVYERMDGHDEEDIYEPIPGESDDHIYAGEETEQETIVLENVQAVAPEDEDEYM